MDCTPPQERSSSLAMLSLMNIPDDALMKIISFVASIPYDEILGRAPSPAADGGDQFCNGGDEFDGSPHGTLTHVFPYVCRALNEISSRLEIWNECVGRLLATPLRPIPTTAHPAAGTEPNLWRDALRETVWDLTRRHDLQRRPSPAHGRDPEENADFRAAFSHLRMEDLFGTETPQRPDIDAVTWRMNKLLTDSPEFRTAAWAGVVCLLQSPQAAYAALLAKTKRKGMLAFFMPGQCRRFEHLNFHLFEPRYKLLMSNIMGGRTERERSGEIIPVCGASQQPPLLRPKFVYGCSQPVGRGARAYVCEVRRSIMHSNQAWDVELVPVERVVIENIFELPQTGRLYSVDVRRMSEARISTEELLEWSTQDRDFYG
mmetsp:Transcript_35058/g.69058  ORF Transcript_35058/g.69058 Transcript_35058/m.69058 type:complete len:374 (-) Transcript_35058:178-1299(-)